MAVRFTTAKGISGKVVMSRLLPSTDLVTGILEVCEASHIQTGVLVSCVGSLRKATIHWSMPSEETKRGSVRTDPVVLEGPIELLNGQGIVGKIKNGEYRSHFHITLCDKEGKVYGGHVFKEGNLVHATMDIVIIEMNQIHLDVEHDEEIDLPLVIAKED